MTAPRPSGWSAWKAQHPDRHRRADRVSKRRRRHACSDTPVYRCPYCLAEIAPTGRRPARAGTLRILSAHLDDDGQPCPGSGCVVA